ncbi:hypothetical protein RB594_005799 [Gaeumannomyces avenae]
MKREHSHGKGKGEACDTPLMGRDDLGGEGAMYHYHTPSPSDAECCSPPAKVQRTGSKVTSALRALTNRTSSTSVMVEPPCTPVPSPTHRGHVAKAVAAGQGFVNKVSSSIFKSAMEPTVVHRSKHKSRPSITSLENSSMRYLDKTNPVASSSAATSATTQVPQTSTNTDANTASSTRSSQLLSPYDSTGKTSLDSKFSGSAKSKDREKNASALSTVTAERRDKKPTGKRRIPRTRSSPESTNLTPIQETDLDQSTATVVTVERAAAAKVYLETFYHNLWSQPTPRSMRRRFLEGDLYRAAKEQALAPGEGDALRLSFYRDESDYLREMRVIKTRSMRALSSDCLGVPRESDYDVLKILGKGSFGVVRLVREKSRDDDRVQTRQRRRQKQVYAMKVIRKSAMLRTCQEGHLRAERDFLVRSEGSSWIVPLMAAFQDTANLYLVMEYMPGGDFLGLLIRENVLHETVARFYAAEMVLCVEAAHALHCIHRDIKPDNFLISASGHLRISDFGLAFDGHWSHDTAYFNSHRYSLVNRLGIKVDGDEQDQRDGSRTRLNMKWTAGLMTGMEKHERQRAGGEKGDELAAASTSPGEKLLDWRNRCGNRTWATSVVGTSQYMAPEVVKGEHYDARCDWWSVGVILYECLYGHTPFLSEDGRHQTKQNILNHHQTFAFPHQPGVSQRCQHLIMSLITDKQNRLCSRRYMFKDVAAGSHPAAAAASSGVKFANGGGSGHGDFADRFVFAYDGEDIKAHKWFRGVPWERLHTLEPPFVPHIRGIDDTHYFEDDEEPVSDWSSTQPSTEDGGVNGDGAADAADDGGGGAGKGVEKPRLAALTRQQAREAEMAVFLRGFRSSIQRMARQWVALPYDSLRLRNIDYAIEQLPGLTPDEREGLRGFVRCYGRKERKRPRDKLLRDRATKGVVLELRKRSAFLGYTWRRRRTGVHDAQRAALNATTAAAAAANAAEAGRTAAAAAADMGSDGFVAMKALHHRGKMY